MNQNAPGSTSTRTVIAATLLGALAFKALAPQHPEWTTKEPF